MCNVNPQKRPEFPVVFESDAAYIVIMILFSVSNGYIASISMMSAPQVRVRVFLASHALMKSNEEYPNLK